jgi:alpha-tubulin suppressor-like RCC1 family protein
VYRRPVNIGTHRTARTLGVLGLDALGVLGVLALAMSAACVDRSDVGEFVAAADGGPSSAEGGGGADGSDGGTSGEGGPTITVIPALTLLAAGGLSTCGIDSQGGAVCWGDNQHGALGIGGFDPSSSQAPLGVSGLGAGVRAVAGGPFAQCAILADGTARCWGDSLFGEIDGTTQSVQMPTPHDKTGLSNDVARIGFGLSFACALTTSGRGKCWGLGGAGQLGTGTTDDQYIAKDLATTESFVDISPSMGGLFACGVTSAGKVMCWGQNGAGQLGSNGTMDQSKPTFVVGLDTTARNVVCGREHACALLSDGTVACWGSDASGQLGRGSAGSAGPNAPTRVPGIASATLIAAGGAHACTIGTGGVMCWGANDFAQIKTGGPAAIGATQISPATDAPLAVTGGLQHTCFMTPPRMVHCLGDSSRMQTGAGSFSL